MHFWSHVACRQRRASFSRIAAIAAAFEAMPALVLGKSTVSLLAQPPT